MKKRQNPSDILNDPAFDEAYAALIRFAEGRCRDRAEADEVVSDTVLSLVQDVRAGKEIDNLTGYLRVVFARRHSDYLRRKYRDGWVTSDDGTLLCNIPDDHDPDALAEAVREAEAVRRALSRLAVLYREAVYRHYMRGESVEQIAAALAVPVGTVKSRLSDGRAHMKNTVSAQLSAACPSPQKTSVAGVSMNHRAQETRTSVISAPDRRPYAELSYAPETMSIGIWGGSSARNEPFSLISSLLAQNILILAYEKPISIRDLSAALDTAAAFVEHEVERLVAGELLGRTAGGLLYTRMFLQRYEASFGDIPAQEALAAEIAPILWRILGEHTAPLWANEASATRTYSHKQTATFWLFLVNHALGRLLHQTPALQDAAAADVAPPLRPNGGWWLATGTVYAHGEGRPDRSDAAHPYAASGPVQVGIGTDYQDALMYDYQSVFGNTHWMYPDMPGSPGLRSVLSLYASLFNEELKVQNERIYECIPDMEALSILRRGADGVIHPDIPGMSLGEWARWETAIGAAMPELTEALAAPLIALRDNTLNRVPEHVDGWANYLHASAFGCLIPATMREMCAQGFVRNAEPGKTPVIFVAYRAPEGQTP